MSYAAVLEDATVEERLRQDDVGRSDWLLAGSSDGWSGEDSFLFSTDILDLGMGRMSSIQAGDQNDGDWVYRHYRPNEFDRLGDGWNDRFSFVDGWEEQAQRHPAANEQVQQDDVSAAQRGHVLVCSEYDGTSRDWIQTSTDIRDLEWMDNRISSIYLGPGQGATFHQYANFEGASFYRIGEPYTGTWVDLRYHPNDPSRIDDWWDNRISSIDIWGAGGYAAPISNEGLVQDEASVERAGYFGATSVHPSADNGYYYGDSFLSYEDIPDLGFMDDRISSIGLSPGQGATFYRYPDFQGPSFYRVGDPTYGSQIDLTGDWWDNRISSVDLWGA